MMRQMALDLHLRDEPSLSGFVVGPNAAVHQALQTLVEQMRPTVPMYLWGDTGVGKSHLLRALHIAWQDQLGQVIDFNAHDTIEISEEAPLTLILMDNCDLWSPEQQQRAFATMIEATAHGWELVAATSVPPVDSGLRDDLRTRLASGLVYQMLPLRDEQLQDALRQEAQRRGLVLTGEVLNYVFTRFSRDLKNLMWLLDALDHYSLVHQRAITVPLLKQMMIQEGITP